MSLKQQLQDDMKTAMRAKDKFRLGVVRMLLAAVKQIEVDTRSELNDSQVLSVVEKLVKQRKESAKQFEAGGRPELAEKEQQEIQVLTAYLPEQLSEAELESLVDQAIQQTGAAAMKDMGKVMGIIKGQAAGRADMSVISSLVKQKLS